MLLALALSTVLLEGPPTIEQPTRSDDGSAELEALRRQGQHDELSAGEVEPEGTRGLELEYGIALDGSVAEGPPAAPGTNPVDHDVIGEADRSLIQRKGRRRVLAGFWMIFSGVLVGPACLAGAVSGARNDQATPAIVLGSLSAVGFGLLGGGIPLVIRGRKMSKHPEQFVGIEPVPRLVLVPSSGGFALHF
jgi:hypothetical protein